jgi:hypothetical protein
LPMITNPGLVTTSTEAAPLKAGGASIRRAVS